MTTDGSGGARDPGGDLQAALATTTDQDLSLQEEGDGLLDGRETDLMLVGQVAPRRQKTLPTLLTNLRLNTIGKVLKNGLFLEFRRRHGVL
jgi:hypothetical protein